MDKQRGDDEKGGKLQVNGEGWEGKMALSRSRRDASRISSARTYGYTYMYKSTRSCVHIYVYAYNWVFDSRFIIFIISTAKGSMYKGTKESEIHRFLHSRYTTGQQYNLFDIDILYRESSLDELRVEPVESSPAKRILQLNNLVPSCREIHTISRFLATVFTYTRLAPREKATLKGIEVVYHLEATQQTEAKEGTLYPDSKWK